MYIVPDSEYTIDSGDKTTLWVYDEAALWWTVKTT